jgi:hypothetical protein
MSSVHLGRKTLIAGAVLLGLVALLVITGSFRFLGSERKWHTLEMRGVPTQATILTSSYDPAGGDPNGWTSEEVVFRANGGLAYAHLGHHGPNAGPASGASVEVVYDPRNPRTVALASELSSHRGDYSVTRVVGFGGVAIGILSAAAALFCVRRALAKWSTAELH